MIEKYSDDEGGVRSGYSTLEDLLQNCLEEGYGVSDGLPGLFAEHKYDHRAAVAFRLKAFRSANLEVLGSQSDTQGQGEDDQS